jgi:predicted nuclease of predicted toxin-antitoxin system
MVKIFADHCVGKFFVESLRRSGADVLTASDAGMERATDEEIFDLAVAEKRILISFDRHFINIARFNIKSSAGMVIFEIDRLGRETIKNRMVDFFAAKTAARLNGRIFVIDLAGTTNVWPKN